MTTMIDPTLMRQTYNVPRRVQCGSSPYSSFRKNSPHLLRIPFSRLNRTIPELASRLNKVRNDPRSDPDDNEDDIFAQLEAEIEDDDNAALREHGMQELKRE